MIRLANEIGYAPKDLELVAAKIREIVGSQNASHFRIGNHAIEFNLFSRDMSDQENQRRLIETHGYKTITVRLLDAQPLPATRVDMLAEGVSLFNGERFWESHEILEQLWKTSNGFERDALQGLILTAAAFVHYQRGEDKICLSVLQRARNKLPPLASSGSVDLERVRTSIDSILKSKQIRLFRLRVDRA